MTIAADFSQFAARLRRFMAQALAAEMAGNCPATQDRFNALALELFALQFARNAVYRKLCAARGFSPETVSHWEQIPAVPTSAFKQFALTSLSQAERTTVFHSSGTT